MKKLRLSAGQIEVTIALEDGPITEALWASLPLRAPAQRWGAEIYFAAPLRVKGGKGQPLVDSGDVAFWEPGRVVCIFFGPTPISAPGEIRPTSEVTVFGKVEGDPTILEGVSAGAEIVVERIESSSSPLA
jgi:uncharacterized protein